MKRNVVAIEDVKILAESRGGKCLSAHYVNSKEKMLWMCSHGHEWMACWNNIQQCGWCPLCARAQRPFYKLKNNGMEYLLSIARANGGTCLATEYLGVGHKYQWRCAAGHEWNSQAYSAHNGNWCRKCADIVRAEKKRRYTIEYMHSLATSMGGKCLSDTFSSVLKKLTWQCSEGHIWDAVPDGIMRRARWCNVCAGITRAKKRLKYTIGDMCEHAAQLGGRCLSKDYRTIGDRLLWQCSEGHIWEAEVSNIIYSAKWCPECNIWRGEKICREYFERITGKKFPKSRPAWLINEKGRKLELDGYCEDICIAFEHHGGQHYKFVKHFHGSAEKFERTQFLDNLKKDLCKKNNVFLIEIPSVLEITGIDNLESFVRKELIKALNQTG